MAQFPEIESEGLKMAKKIGAERVSSATRVAIDRKGKDCMGYSLRTQLKGYTDLDIEAARVLAKDAGYQWDCVYEDPAVTGKRFLQSAKLVRQFIETQS